MVVKRRRVGPLVVAGLGVVGLAGLALLEGGPSNAEGTLLVALIAFLAVGALVLWRAPGNRLGWVLSLIGLALLASAVAGALSDRGLVAGDAIGGALWFGWLVLTGFLFLWFPTGRVPSRLWRVVEWIGFLSALIAVSYVFSEQLCMEFADAGGCALWVTNPIGIPGVPNPEYGPLSGFSLLFQAGYILLALAAFVTRFVRSKGIERLQLKWFLYAALLLVGAIGLEEAMTSLPSWVNDSLFGVAVAGLPVGIGIGILKFRLYDIDRIVSRTVGYALVVAVLAGVYVGIAVWLPSRIPGEQSPVFVAGATLLTVGAFNPVRRRILRVVDRRFHRSRYDSEAVMTDFASHVREHVDIDRISTEWLEVVDSTMRPVSVGLWMRDE